MSNFQKIKEARPDIDSDTIREAADRLDNLQAFAVLTESQEGRAYIEQKVKEAGYILRKIISDNAEGKPVSVDVCRIEALINLIIELKGVKDDADAQQEVVDELVRTM